MDAHRRRPSFEPLEPWQMLAGDCNLDASVDAADYVACRKFFDVKVPSYTQYR